MHSIVELMYHHVAYRDISPHTHTLLESMEIIYKNLCNQTILSRALSQERDRDSRASKAERDGGKDKDRSERKEREKEKEKDRDSEDVKEKKEKRTDKENGDIRTYTH